MNNKEKIKEKVWKKIEYFWEWSEAIDKAIEFTQEETSKHYEKKIKELEKLHKSRDKDAIIELGEYNRLKKQLKELTHDFFDLMVNPDELEKYSKKYLKERQ